ncbi:hypothetical protein BC2230_90293 [Burkholderia cepacia]
MTSFNFADALIGTPQSSQLTLLREGTKKDEPICTGAMSPARSVHHRSDFSRCVEYISPRSRRGLLWSNAIMFRD